MRPEKARVISIIPVDKEALGSNVIRIRRLRRFAHRYLEPYWLNHLVYFAFESDVDGNHRRNKAATVVGSLPVAELIQWVEDFKATHKINNKLGRPRKIKEIE